VSFEVKEVKVPVTTKRTVSAGPDFFKPIHLIHTLKPHVSSGDLKSQPCYSKQVGKLFQSATQPTSGVSTDPQDLVWTLPARVDYARHFSNEGLITGSREATLSSSSTWTPQELGSKAEK
jgi:hypothetical protein